MRQKGVKPVVLGRRRTPMKRRAFGALVGVAFLVAACGSGGGSGAAPGTSGTTAAAPRTVTVFAAASLTESFQALGKQFEAQHAGVSVKFNFAGSSGLVQQLLQGSKADVFASADQANMDKGVSGGVIDGQPVVFATNTLTIVVAKGNPKHITSFADLANKGLTVVVCAPQVPCGSAAQKVEKNTGITLKPASEEQDVKSVLAKVQSGDADAGIVYVTDAASAAGKVDRVDFPQAAGAVNSYPIALVKNAPEAELGREFITFVLGTDGKRELTGAGFGTP